MNDLQVNGVTLGYSTTDYSDPNCIVDSGTTFLLLPSGPLSALEDVLVGMCSDTTLYGLCNTAEGQSILDSYCYPMTSSQIAQYPTLTIYLSGLTSPITLTPDIYLTPLQQNEQNLRCFGISSAGSFGTILGDTFMRSSHVVFDRAGNQVGFGPLSTCPNSPASTTASTGQRSSASISIPSLIMIFLGVSVCLLSLL